MVMHFVLIQMFICFSYDKTSLKFCASFRFFLAVFMEQFQKNPLSELCEKRNPIDAPFLVQNGRACGVGDRYNYVHKLHITRFSLFYQFTVFMSTAHSVADRAERRD